MSQYSNYYQGYGGQYSTYRYPTYQGYGQQLSQQSSEQQPQMLQFPERTYQVGQTEYTPRDLMVAGAHMEKSRHERVQEEYKQQQKMEYQRQHMEYQKQCQEWQQKQYQQQQYRQQYQQGYYSGGGSSSCCC